MNAPEHSINGPLVSQFQPIKRPHLTHLQEVEVVELLVVIHDHIKVTTFLVQVTGRATHTIGELCFNELFR